MEKLVSDFDSIPGIDAPVLVRINQRARRVSLRIDHTSRTLIVTAPRKKDVPDALVFAAGKRDWISKQLSAVAPLQPFVDGVVFPLQGQDCKVRSIGGVRAPTALKGRTLLVSGDAAHLNRRVIDWLKKEARILLCERVNEFTDKLGVTRGKISVRDTKSRWGSCSTSGDLSFSWRLIMTPPPIFDYVVAHECAHRIHMDHSDAFWSVVDDLGVDAKSAGFWFRKNGADLFRWGAVPDHAASK